MTSAITSLNELREQAWAILDAISSAKADIEALVHSPSCDEDYKLAWHPGITHENLAKLAELARELAELAGKVAGNQ